MINLDAIRRHVEAMLTAGLSKSLAYHGLHHTLDVTSQCLAIAEKEGITDRKTLLELQVAGLYHDSGFMFTYENHELKGCEIAGDQLPAFGLSRQSIDSICDLIMATKVPQSPNNELQRIICDADLDYLGREDFFETGNKLRKELIAYGFISDDHDWEERQLKFLQAHHYFTQTSRENREPVKKAFIRHLLKIKGRVT